MTRILFAVLSAIRTPTVPAVLLGLVLAACADSPERPPVMHIAASVADQTLQLAVNDIPPGREITALLLIDADGRETQAQARELITREEGSGGNAGPGVGIGASGGSSSGITPHISLGYLFRGSDTTRRSQRMTAEIPIPDPQAYAAGYRDWRIEVRYRDQLGDAQRVSIPAPPP